MGQEMPEMFEKVGRYQLVSLLGGGGMGEVWSVVDPGLGIAKALKVLRPQLGWDDQYRNMFAREAKVAAQLGRHPGFPAIHDFDASGDLPYLVMDYIDGVNLRALCGGRRLTEGLVVHVMRALFRSLMIAHGNRRGNSEANVVHGDLKPENIMVSSHGDVFLTDFGISRVVEGRVVTSSVIGTVPYMAPETFDGVVCVQSDLFSAGLILHELLCGERVHPKRATVFEVKKAYKRGVPSLDVDVHPQLETLRQMLLQVEVDDRLPSASDALDALQRVESIDRHDELSELYLRLIGPPHTGLTQYLQAMDSQGSFLPAYFEERERERAQGPRSTVTVQGAEELESEGPGHTVAVSEEEQRALRSGNATAHAPSVEAPVPEAAIPTPSDILQASTEPVAAEFLGERPIAIVRDDGPKKSVAAIWLGLMGVLLVAMGAGAGLGYAWLRAPDAEGDTRSSSGETKSDAFEEAEVRPVSEREGTRADVSFEVDAQESPSLSEVETDTKEVSEDVSEELLGGSESDEERQQLPQPQESKERRRASTPKSKVVFYIGSDHPAAAVKVGRRLKPLADLRGEPVFEELLPPGRVTLSLCEADGVCRRYGSIRVPALEASESLFVNLRHERPQVQRRGP